MYEQQYPIGEFKYQPYGEAQRNGYIDTIRRLPERLRGVVEHFTEAQLEQSYRPGGWSARQLIHHIADSHMNAYIRFKLILTEEKPVLKTYEEKLWAELQDTYFAPVEASLSILDGLHRRWVSLLEGISGPQWERTGFHPEHHRDVSLLEFLALYDWHSRHHLEHLRIIAESRHTG
ncbi:MAG: putative metal-dependent hydrolase [Phaeodactylibacter sp.]|nr:putative metal-dependent hydrolase [Phaeodactylibacter sp.]MCB9273751.1 putative metal-dependent hydrolase [Lewinellaceae bacterium]